MCSEPTAGAATPSCRVVVVDADRRVRRDLAGLVDLGDGSACVGVAGDPVGALELIRRVDPDVVVVDPRLPDVAAGLALVARVRHESDARIVVLGDDPALRERARSLGADEFVVKDADLSPLVEAIVRTDRRHGREPRGNEANRRDRRQGNGALGIRGTVAGLGRGTDEGRGTDG